MSTARVVPAGPVVLDATFLIDVFRTSHAIKDFLPVLKRANVTSVNFGEALYKLAETSTMSAVQIEKALLTAGLEVADVDLNVTRRFPNLRAIDKKCAAAEARAGRASTKTLSLGDLICLGFAVDKNWPVLTADKHWLLLPKHGLSVDVYDYRDPSTSL